MTLAAYWNHRAGEGEGAEKILFWIYFTGLLCSLGIGVCKAYPWRLE